VLEARVARFVIFELFRTQPLACSGRPRRAKFRPEKIAEAGAAQAGHGACDRAVTFGLVQLAVAAGYRQYHAYSQCMRSRGASFWPEPSEVSHGVFDSPYAYLVTARILAQEHGPGWQAALAACRMLTPPGLPFTAAQITACMRGHGITRFPNPVVNPSGGGFPSPGQGWCAMIGGMTAQPADDYDPDDPVEILHVLPARFREQFLAEYEVAVAGAKRPEQYRHLHHVLRLWRLRAVAYSDPGYEVRLESARVGSDDWTPVEEVVPDWADRVAAAQRRRAGE
jgi:hypothetical protein